MPTTAYYWQTTQACSYSLNGVTVSLTSGTLVSPFDAEFDALWAVPGLLVITSTPAPVTPVGPSGPNYIYEALLLREDVTPTDGQIAVYDATSGYWLPADDSGGGGSSPDATATVKGLLKLTGDLGGTASSPTVPGLAGKQAADADLTALAAIDATTAGAIGNDGSGWIKKTYAAFKTALTIVKGDVGLGSVDNTSDASKPVSTLQAAANATVLASAEAYTDVETARAQAAEAAITAGLKFKAAVVVATANVASLSGLPTTDGITLTDSQVILLVAQTTASQNGLWAVHSGAWVRPTNFAHGADATATSVYVESGTANSSGTFVVVGAGPNVIDTNSITWQQASGLGEVVPGTALSKTGNTINVTLGTGSTTAAAGNDARLSDARTPTAHKSTHATGGTDALTPADIGAAPLASPGLTGNPTAPTQTALDSSTKLSTTAYSDTAVAVEKSRAQAAETALGTVSGCRVFNSAAQSLANGSLVALTFDSERYDTASYHSTSSNTSRITVPTTGKYNIFGGVEFAANGTGLRYVFFRVNGSAIIAKQVFVPTSGDDNDIQMSTTYALTAGDYVELVLLQTSGGALNSKAAANSAPEFGITFIGI